MLALLKAFYNSKKVPIIPPLLISNKLISDFEVKAIHCNNFNASQCTLFITLAKFLKLSLI